MSLESKIEALTNAVAALTAQLQSGTASVPQQASPVQPPVAAPAPVAAASSMPALPTFAATPPAAAPAPAAAAAPFTDAQGLMAYTMAAYQALGAEKGARIMAILQQWGYGNLNEVKPEQYAQFYSGVEALKAS